jgi:hypothetical protein
VLYSPGRRFVFVKTPKTAGTTMEIALSCHLLDDKDVLTPLGPADELLRLALAGSSPRNCFHEHGISRSALERRFHAVRAGLHAVSTERDVRQEILALLAARHRRDLLRIRNHAKIDTIIDFIGAEAFRSCFSCGFVREPLARALSQFLWSHRDVDFTGLTVSELRASFLAFLRDRFRSLRSHLESARHPGCGVAKVYRFEDLDAGYRDICDQLGIPALDRLAFLPSAKSSSSRRQQIPFPKQELLTEEAGDLARQVGSWEYERYYS